MAEIILKIALPEEIKDALWSLPPALRTKIEAAAGQWGMDGMGLYIKLMAVLSMPEGAIPLEPVERDILEELRLALHVGREGRSGKALDLAAGRQAAAERNARFQAWADSHGPDTPLLTDEAISREAIYSRD